MTDVAGKPLRNRAIVIVRSTELHKLCYGVIQFIWNHGIEVKLIHKEACYMEWDELIEIPSDNILQIKHDQLPSKIRDRLIELSKIRVR